MAQPNNILPKNDELNEEQLLNYIANNLSDKERHTVESQMLENDFINDAIEGLQQFQNKQHIEDYVYQLNKHLAKQTAKKKIKIAKRKLKQQDWIVIAVIIILMLCLLGYLVVKELEKTNATLNKPA
jgi:DNA primase